MKWLLQTFVLAFIRNWPVIFRANLYFWSAWLVVISEKLAGILYQDEWPSLPYTCGSLVAATGAALIALRAFYDGASQRHQDAHADDASSKVTRTEVKQTVVASKPADPTPPVV